MKQAKTKRAKTKRVKMKRLPTFNPKLQIAFYYRLKILRDIYLTDALKKTVSELKISEIDKELAAFVNDKTLNKIASHGIRGEVFLPVPILLNANPKLLGYYRLLYGLSQKEIYTKGSFSRFRRMEESGQISPTIALELGNLCQSLIRTGEHLIQQLDDLSLDTVNSLQLLTLGPQLRGGRNTDLGKVATDKTFTLMKRLVTPYITKATDKAIILRNDSKRIVKIEFSPDPDIQIVEELASGDRPLVSIEIKGGEDASNIHNRLGEAEKSHQKAKGRGFFEFWTIIRVDMDYAIAKKESPTTSHFFNLDKLYDLKSDESKHFKDLLGSILSIQIQ